MCTFHMEEINFFTKDGTQLQYERIMPYIYPGLELFCHRHASRNHPKRTSFLLSKFSAFVLQKRNFRCAPIESP